MKACNYTHITHIYIVLMHTYPHICASVYQYIHVVYCSCFGSPFCLLSRCQGVWFARPLSDCHEGFWHQQKLAQGCQGTPPAKCNGAGSDIGSGKGRGKVKGKAKGEAKSKANGEVKGKAKGKSGCSGVSGKAMKGTFAGRRPPSQIPEKKKLHYLISATYRVLKKSNADKGDQISMPNERDFHRLFCAMNAKHPKLASMSPAGAGKFFSVNYEKFSSDGSEVVPPS